MLEASRTWKLKLLHKYKIYFSAIWCEIAILLSLQECKGVPKTLINLTQALYDNASCRILHEAQMSDGICILAGLRQRLVDLDYADDI